MNTVVKYFDIFSNLRPELGRGSGAGLQAMMADATAGLSWLPQWLALLAGVFVQPYFAEYQKSSHWAFAGFGGWFAASVIIALVVFPAVYRGAFDPTKPWVIQIVPIFTAGLGWNALFSVAVKAAGH